MLEHRCGCWAGSHPLRCTCKGQFAEGCPDAQAIGVPLNTGVGKLGHKANFNALSRDVQGRQGHDNGASWVDLRISFGKWLGAEPSVNMRSPIMMKRFLQANGKTESG